MPLDNSGVSVTVLLPNRGVDTIQVRPSTTVQQVIDILTSDDTLRGLFNEDIGDESISWTLQLVKEEKEGRAWEEDELAAVGDGMLCISVQRLIMLM